MVDKASTQTTPQRGRPKRPPAAQRLHGLTLRLPEELLRRLDTYTTEVQAAQPHLWPSRADVPRLLLDRALPDVNS